MVLFSAYWYVNLRALVVVYREIFFDHINSRQTLSWFINIRDTVRQTSVQDQFLGEGGGVKIFLTRELKIHLTIILYSETYNIIT